MLGNTFGAIPVFLLKILVASNSQIVSLNRNRSISIKETSKEWMFFILTNTKSFMEPQCSVIQSSAMAHPYKRAIADVQSEKNIFSTVESTYSELWRGDGSLFNIITVRNWFEKNKID